MAGIVKLKLTRRKYALVDADAPAEVFEGRKWYADRREYKGRVWWVVRRKTANGRERLGRVVMGAKVGEEVDHINGDGLDNRRENLRICTHAENGRNLRVHHGRGWKGVTRELHNGRRSWRAQIAAGGRRYRLGWFKTKAEAIAAYDAAALMYHGRFALTNAEWRRLKR